MKSASFLSLQLYLKTKQLLANVNVNTDDPNDDMNWVDALCLFSIKLANCAVIHSQRSRANLVFVFIYFDRGYLDCDPC